jgi:multiple sugar transport system permease protein
MDRGFLSNIELRTWRGATYYGFAMLILILVSLVALFPFFFAFTSGLKGSTELFSAGINLFPKDPQWGNYVEAWQRFNLPRLLGNSFLIVGGGIVFQLFVSTTAAYSLSRLNPWGGRYLMMAFLLTLMVPPMAYFVPLFLTIKSIPIVNISLIDSYWGLWLPYSVSAFAIFILKTFFDRIPADILDSARVDGANPLQVFFMIVVPLSRSILIVICVLAFVNIWRDYLLPLLVITDPSAQPVTVRLVDLSTEYGVNLQMASSFIALLPPLLVAIVMQRYMAIGVTGGAIKG